MTQEYDNQALTLNVQPSVQPKPDRRKKAHCQVCGGKLDRPDETYAWSHTFAALDKQHVAVAFPKPVK